ncbi:hypothetical protein B9Z65_7232 [Elsinoe australis]|uniref:Telomerase reverse transcriptase n=1 Tax=Elsinoe australis TaxID=40998 RepID=A0A2P7Z672_9PEZI|nr:hypothetical protein B9Z65_7232 [Elsinoe australis]
MKRKRPEHGELKARKRARSDDKIGTKSTNLPDSNVLRSYYPKVETLRQYLVSRLSKKRSRALNDATRQRENHDAYSDGSRLGALFDSTLIGSSVERSEEQDHGKHLSELKVFSQRRSESASGSSSSSQQVPIQNIIDYCIWSLFRKHPKTPYPPHILCHGYARSSASGQNGLQLSASCEIPGLVSHNPNQYVERFKSSPWNELPKLLGGNADRILVSLVMECGIYALVGPSGKNWIQISGTPLTELPQETLDDKPANKNEKSESVESGFERSPNAIRFVRHRMLYGKPTMNASGGVTFGQRPIHVLNRCKDLDDDQETTHVMKYIFPREFGLHNVFTSTVTKEESAQPFLDYTLREQEIKRQKLHQLSKRQTQGDNTHGIKSKIPKRLRGAPFELVRAIRKRHKSCSYSQLINHYCPINPTPSSPDSVFALATPTAQVSAFCRAAINHVFPSALWGDPHNHSHLLKSITHFISLRRYESLTLHTILQHLHLTSISWLCPPSHSSTSRLSRPERNRRLHLLSQLLYYTIDSYLVPLLSTNFYITESAAHKNALLFFRHDVWLRLSTPALASLTSAMFEPLPPSAARKVSARSGLGTSRVRLLPKESGLRPIINLRRRAMVRGRDGKMVLGRSVNAALRPAFAVLGHEKDARREVLGKSVFSVEEVLPRLADFKRRLKEGGWRGGGLWFVKGDVRGAFDSIPQGKLMGLLREVVRCGEYSVGRYAEGRKVGRGKGVAWKFRCEAQPSGVDETLSQVLEEVEGGKEGRVFVDKVVRRYEGRGRVLDTLGEHVERNVVQIGKRLYRQKMGIPQGSVVSSLLCSLFYGQMDGRELGFLEDGECLMTRLIDDFLLITPDLSLAKKFVEVMHKGLREYGVTIGHEKSRTNFDVSVDGMSIQRLPLVAEFPYCGLAINTADLNVSVDESRRQGRDTQAAVTVEHSKSPGQSFHRKALDTAKLHMHSILMSTAFNDLVRVQENVYQAFTDMAWRCVHYLDSMSSGRQPSAQLVIRTVEDLTDFAYSLMKNGQRVKGQSLDHKCLISRQQMQR